jgi:uncharacterized protein (UPF0332 family)
MMSDVSVHVFLYYEDMGSWLLYKLKEFYSGPIYLSLVKDNAHNKKLLTLARSLFDIDLTYVDNCGTDQVGFYKTMKKDKMPTKWILYLHDKSESKKQWLEDLINPLMNVNKNLLNSNHIGIISAESHKHKTYSIQEILNHFGKTAFNHRKKIVQNMHTVVWLKELQRILLEKHELIKENDIYPDFCAGIVFMARKEIVQKAHDCVYDEFFNNYYREDGEVGHGLERFYFYVSQCMNYKNLFI